MRQRFLFILFTIIFLLFRICVNAQLSRATDGKLYSELATLDSVVFANVYTCNSAKNQTFFTDDIEFYHDKGGLTKSKKTLVDELRNNFCGEGKTKLRRELVKGSMQVYPISNYGAVQLGDHRFYVTQNGKEVLSGVAKFIHIWKYENGEWRISRVFSYDHNAPDAKSASTSEELHHAIADLNLVFRRCRQFAHRGVGRCCIHKQRQILRARLVTTRQAGRLDIAGVLHAERTRLGVHHAHKGRQSTRIGAT